MNKWEIIIVPGLWSESPNTQWAVMGKKHLSCSMKSQGIEPKGGLETYLTQHKNHLQQPEWSKNRICGLGKWWVLYHWKCASMWCTTVLQVYNQRDSSIWLGKRRHESEIFHNRKKKSCFKTFPFKEKKKFPFVRSVNASKREKRD